MKKIILNLVLIAAISISAKSQLIVDSTSIIHTCLDCDSISVSPLPNAYGSLYISVSGGVSPYTFSLTGQHAANSIPLVTSSISGITNFYNSLCQDTFSLMISDANGGSITYNFTTVPPLPPTLSIDSVSVKADSTNNPDSGVIELHVTTNADSIFYLIQDMGNTLNLGTNGGWQDSTVFDSLPGGYYYKVFVDIYPKIFPSCANGIDTGTSVFQIYVPLACENDGFADFAAIPACVGDPTYFPEFSFPGSGVNNVITDWMWDFGDGNFGNGQYPVNVYTQPGIYMVNLQISTSHGCLFVVSYPVTIESIPIPSFNYTQNGTGQYTFTDQSTTTLGAITSWLWDFGDGNTSTTQNPIHQYAVAGTYTVCLIAYSSVGCNDSICQNIDTSVGIDGLATQNEYEIFPNPVENRLTITNFDKAIRKIEILDLTGKKVNEFIPKSGSIDVQELPKGIYFIKIITTQNTLTKKFVKK